MTTYEQQLRGRDPLPVEEVLQMILFAKNQFGCHERRWGALQVAAGEWLGGWHFHGMWSTGRTMGMPEFRTSPAVAPVKLLMQLYHSCRMAFGRDALPLEFEIGREEVNYQAKTRALVPPPPTVWADREFFRFCLAIINQRNDSTENDYVLRFSTTKDQLQIQTGPHVLCCPARGAFLGVTEISARAFFRRLPMRFTDDVVALQQRGDALIVASRVIPAKWTDQEEETPATGTADPETDDNT